MMNKWKIDLSFIPFHVHLLTWLGRLTPCRLHVLLMHLWASPKLNNLSCLPRIIYKERFIMSFPYCDGPMIPSSGIYPSHMAKSMLGRILPMVKSHQSQKMSTQCFPRRNINTLREGRHLPRLGTLNPWSSHMTNPGSLNHITWSISESGCPMLSMSAYKHVGPFIPWPSHMTNLGEYLLVSWDICMSAPFIPWSSHMINLGECLPHAVSWRTINLPSSREKYSPSQYLQSSHLWIFVETALPSRHHVPDVTTLLHALTTIYSASTILSATEVYLQLSQNTIANPKLKQHSEVSHLSTALPSQLEFV